LLELTNVKCSQLRAGSVVQNCSDLIVEQTLTISNVGHKTLQQIRKKVLDSLEDETFEVVTLKQGSTVIDTLGQVGDINTGEGVDLAGIATDAQELRILLGSGDDIGQEEWDGVLVTDGALVPVVWNALVTLGPGKAARLAGDGIEGLENFLVENTFGVLRGLVGHEAVDESVGGRLHQNAGEGTVEEVRVLVDGLVEAGCTEGCQDTQVVVCGCCIGLRVEHLLELTQDHLVIVAARLC